MRVRLKLGNGVGPKGHRFFSRMSKFITSKTKILQKILISALCIHDWFGNLVEFTHWC